MPTLQVAHHEAGHAVLALLTGIFVIYDDTNIWNTQCASMPIERRKDLCLARGTTAKGVLDFEFSIIAAGGYAAECIFLTRRGQEIDEEALFLGAHGDILHVIETLGKGRWFECVEKAKGYLSDPDIWQTVENLANRIFQTPNKSVSADITTEVIERTFAERRIMSLKVLT